MSEIKRTKIGDINEKLSGKQVKINGWVDTIREHGKLLFLDIRDISGILQTIITSKDKDFDEAKKLTAESCIEIIGKIGKRPKGTENKDNETGKVELKIESINILNLCPPLPFDLNNQDTSEEIRLKYRYLDLRTKKMQENLILRGKAMHSIREFLDSESFNEIETPFLAKSTPEGARDYIVPSRTQKEKFFALPQSPQLFKQLLMVSGFDRYYQIVRCMRDEDLRSDRQPEFTQIDIELSFTTQEEIIETMEKMIQKLWKDTLNINIKIPFKRMNYDEAIKKHNTDCPDLRKDKNNQDEYAFVWVLDFPLFEFSKEEKKLASTHHPFTMPEIKSFKKDPKKAKSLAYDLVLNGVEIGGGSIRIHNAEIQQQVFKTLNISESEQQEKFGFLLDALKFGAPPHGGIAFGFDRIIQILTNSESIREVIAFPKNQEARDLMLDAPSTLSDKQLKDAHIKLDVSKKKK